MTFFKKEALSRLQSDIEEKKHTILLVDDEPSNLKVLTGMLNPFYNLETAADGKEALELIENDDDPTRFQLIVSDQRMPRMNGVTFLEKTIGIIPHTKRIILTGYSDLDAVIGSINVARVCHFLLKPVVEEELIEVVKSVLEDYDAEMQQSQENDAEIVGQHPNVLELVDNVRRLADSDAPVLVRGETGTGKELVARALHRYGARSGKPLVTVHCGALPETLFESELFGHKRGAFTDARGDRLGRVAQAHGGTLFIDEVGEIPLASQAKLLRFFQFGEFQRLGSDQVEKVDVRIVAATHRDLAKMVEEGTFRQDLYYRLNVLEVRIPALRERASDIPMLVDHFLRKEWKGAFAPRLSPQTLMILQRYEFPGNVRELQHMVERACVLVRGTLIGPDLLPPEVLTAVGAESKEPISAEAEPQFHFDELTNEVLKEVRDEARRIAGERVEKAFLEQLLKVYKGNVKDVSERAGMNEKYLHRLLSKHGMRR